MVMSNQDFAKEVLRLAGSKEPFKPFSYYDPDGDCIEFLISNDDYYAERVDELLTVYYSRSSNEIVGSLIKGVSKLYRDTVSKLPGFAIEVVDGKVRLSCLFRVGLWSERPSANQILVRMYKKLAEYADQYNVETDAMFVH